MLPIASYSEGDGKLFYATMIWSHIKKVEFIWNTYTKIFSNSLNQQLWSIYQFSFLSSLSIPSCII